MNTKSIRYFPKGKDALHRLKTLTLKENSHPGDQLPQTESQIRNN